MLKFDHLERAPLGVCRSRLHRELDNSGLYVESSRNLWTLLLGLYLFILSSWSSRKFVVDCFVLLPIPSSGL